MKSLVTSPVLLAVSLLEVNFAFAKKIERQGAQGQLTDVGAANKISCATYQCSAGWQPKTDHIDLTAPQGDTNLDPVCCEATCALWTCGPHFLSNSQYNSNVGDSDQVCCDRTCQDDFQCGPNTTSRGPGQRGASVAECCGPICAVYSCTDGWVKEPAHDAKVAKKHASGPEECCVKSCELFNCSLHRGFVTNEDVLDIPGDDTLTCCNSQCYILDCGKDRRMPVEMNETIGNLDSCCQPICSGFACPKGYVPNPNVTEEFGNSTSECCLPTCGSYSCTGAWANSTDAIKLALLTLTNENCCERACNVYTCSSDWVAKEDWGAEAGKTDEACCDKTCAIHTCSAGFRKRNETIFNGTRGDDDAICCEPESCEVFDNRTAKEVRGCNSVIQASCEATYVLFNVAIDNETNSTYSMACEWGGANGLPICRNTATPLIGCTVSM